MVRRPRWIKVDGEYLHVNDVRWLLYERDQRCAYCRQEIPRLVDFTLDHVVPLAKGGKHEFENLVGCCSSCNRDKGQMSAAEYLETKRER